MLAASKVAAVRPELKLPDIAHLHYQVHVEDGLGGPAGHFDPVFEVLLLHSLALGNQFAAFQVAVDLQDCGPAVGAPFTDGAQLLPELFFSKSGNIVYR